MADLQSKMLLVMAIKFYQWAVRYFFHKIMIMKLNKQMLLFFFYLERIYMY